ncbi:MAG TPA: DUF1553 domain-containing protein [Pirellulaceae bacterium]|nr:DUF1553 domain-containing protein [Pirellulaceae bacterium]HMO91403.1 DUF1553 domain-containing protein [Pirellulaceae bacterium]HMP69628.1 DUF1553 domain-containing protein [Pirellulaceae bacterium]
MFTQSPHTKYLFFWTVFSVGLCAVVYSLWPQPRVSVPRTYRSNWYHQPKIAALITAIDKEYADRWENEGLSCADEVDTFRVIRRISLGLIGTIPSLEELRVLEKLPREQQVNWWVSRLLEDRRCSDYLAERFARIYVGVDDGPFIVFRRRRFVHWLSDQFYRNVGYDQIIRQLLAGDGLWTDSPAVNFITATIDVETGKPDPIRLAGRTSRAFLGIRMDCLQCHDDFLGNVALGDAEHLQGGVQSNFHELAAFFAQVQNNIGGVRDTLHSPAYRYQYLGDDEATSVAAAVPYGGSLVVSNDSLRKQLVEWMTHRDNRPVARTIVNRVWAILCGKPLVQPIDHLPLYGPFPPGLELLVDDFVEHGYDLHRLIRVIVGTKVFRLDSNANFEITSKHRRLWAVFPTSSLRPEQVAGSIIQSTSLQTIDASASILLQLAKFGQEQQFVERFGDWGEDELSAPPCSTVTQQLLMMNGEMIQDRLTQGFNAPQQAARLSPDETTIVTNAFLATLTRPPTEQERMHFCQQLSGLRGEERIAAIEDLYWTLINGGEFSWNY